MCFLFWEPVSWFFCSLFGSIVFPFHLCGVAMVVSWSEGTPIFGKLSVIKELGKGINSRSEPMRQSLGLDLELRRQKTSRPHWPHISRL